MDGRATVRNLILELLEKGNVNQDKYVATEVVNHDRPQMRGYESLKETGSTFVNAFSDRHVTIDEIIAEDSVVAISLTFSGKHKGEVFGIPPTGKRVSFKIIGILRLAGNKVVEHWGVLDERSLTQQLAGRRQSKTPFFQHHVIPAERQSALRVFLNQPGRKRKLPYLAPSKSLFADITRKGRR